MKKYTKASFKAYLRGIKAAWIVDKTESVIAIHKAALDRYSAFINYGEKNGYLSRKDEGKYVGFYFTDKGLGLAQELAETTCAFSGKAVR